MLLGAALISLCHAQPQQPTSEAQARYYVYGAFLTHAVPEILGDSVALGPELAQRLGVASGADRKSIYDALMSYTDKRPLSVRKATSDEVARYKPRAKRELKDPLFAVQAGDVMLLVEYDLTQNTIPFVGQLDVALLPPRAAPPVAAPPVAAPPVAAPPAPEPRRAAPPVATIAPRPVPVKPAPMPVRPQELLKPNGPCQVKPVMSEQDLANCRGAPGGAARVQPGPPTVVKPQAAAKPVAPTPARTGPCEVKPVMTEEDLANCRAAPMTRVQPGPAIVVKPQARIEPTPQPQRGPCLVKPVMSEEDLANCRAAPGGSARIDPGALAAPRPAAATSQPAPKPAAQPCTVKPVMSEEDLIACGIRR